MVRLSEEEVKRLSPAAKRQMGSDAPIEVKQTSGQDALPGRRLVSDPNPPKKPARTVSRGNVAESVNKKYGASEGSTKAASFTRQAYRASGGGKAGFTSIRGLIWVFVWLGVLFYLVAHPTTVPTLVHLVFAPVNGVIAVANGASHLTPKG